MNAIPEGRSRVGKALRGVGAAFAVFLTVELLLRVTIPKESLLFTWERPSGMAGVDGSGAIGTRANQQGSAMDGPTRWTYASTDDGFRESRPVARAKPAGTVRLVTLGDSWIFGFSVDQRWTFDAQLEVSLGEKIHRTVEIVNNGCFGCSAFDMYAKWVQVRDVLTLDGVIIGLPHNENHQTAALQARAQFLRDAETPLTPRNFWLYLLLRRALYQVRTPAVAENVLDAADTASVVDIQRIVSEARARHLKVWFVGWPPTWWHNEPSLVSVDPASAMASVKRSAITRRWTEAMDTVSVAQGWLAMAQRSCWGWTDLAHPSGAGQGAMAALMVDVITTNRTKFATLPSCDANAAPGPGK